MIFDAILMMFSNYGERTSTTNERNNGNERGNEQNQAGAKAGHARFDLRNNEGAARGNQAVCGHGPRQDRTAEGPHCFRIAD